jgi:hypothetical protein
MKNETKPKCANCAAQIEFGEDVRLVYNADTKKALAILCLSCKDIETFDLSTPFVPPIEGSFRPVYSSAEIEEFRQVDADRRVWHEIEQEITQFVAKEPHILKLTVSSRQFAKMAIAFDWNGATLIALTFTGDWPVKDQIFDIYQRHRLAQMGLVEEGAKNTVWRLDLTEAERKPENVGRIASHVLEFGLFARGHWINGETATLDFDSREPSIAEYQ